MNKTEWDQMEFASYSIKVDIRHIRMVMENGWHGIQNC